MQLYNHIVFYMFFKYLFYPSSDLYEILKKDDLSADFIIQNVKLL